MSRSVPRGYEVQRHVARRHLVQRQVPRGFRVAGARHEHQSEVIVAGKGHLRQRRGTAEWIPPRTLR